jgi:hypothetical protein
MASNESKVLGPAAPVDQLSTNAEGRALNRRNLMAGFGIAGAVIGAGLFSRLFPGGPSVVEASNAIPTGFSEVDYLNFLLNLKYLQATFYSYVTQGKDLPGTNPQGSAAITAVAATASTLTVTAANTFAAGQAVIISGLTTASASITGVSATPTTVTITSPSAFSVGQSVVISGLSVALANITNVAATAPTVTVTAANTFAAGQTNVVIAGLTGTLAQYNGTVTIASANSSSFTFNNNNLVSVPITNIAATATTVTVTAANSFGAGQTVVVSGLTGALAGYNGTFTIASASSANFTFALAGPVLTSTATTGTATSLSGVASTTVASGTAAATLSLAPYNGTFTIATATSSAFTFPLASSIPILGTQTPAGAASITIPVSQYNSVNNNNLPFTIASATASAFTFAFTTPLPFGSVTAPASTAVATAPNSPYKINGTINYPAQGTNTVFEQYTVAPLITSFYTSSTFSNGANGQQIVDMLNEIYYDELNQLIGLQNLVNAQIPSTPTPTVGTGAIVRPPIDLQGKGSSSTSTTTPTATTARTILAQARLLEDLSVTAFAGVAQFLTGSNLTAVTQMLAVDGTHAGALRLAIIQWNANNTAANAIVDLVADSNIVPAQAGLFWSVQADDVAPVDQGTAALAAQGPEVVAVPVQIAATENVTNPCTAPIVPFADPAYITNVTATAATVTVVANNNFSGTQAGVVISGLTGALAAFNGTFTLVTASATGFTFSNTVAPAPGTVVASTPVTLGTATAYAAAANTYSSCTPTQFQGFFNTAGALTATGALNSSGSPSPNAYTGPDTPAGFAFARTTSQVLSVLYASSPGATPSAPALPSPNTNPLGQSNNELEGGWFPTAVGGVITTIVS